METIKIDGVEIPIEKLEEAGFKRVEPELKLKGGYNIRGDEGIVKTEFCSSNYIESGNAFPTKEEAKEAVIRRTPANLLDCWITHFEREEKTEVPKINWDDKMQTKYFIYFNWDLGKYCVRSQFYSQKFGVRYTTSKIVIDKVRKLLNEGKINIGEIK